HFIDEVDKARSRRLMAMFGTDWRDPNRFDLILNMEKMRREGAKRMIIEAAKLEEYQPTAASNQSFKDLALGCLIYAELFASPVMRELALEVRAEGGHIHVTGSIEQGLEYKLANLVKKVPGVTDVTTDFYAVQPETYFGL
ncbi:MAG TPA: hypothetical protein VHV54_06615, partial [Candidatus Binatia bacterium]|nr:hypothetical protein [Candidatus Binatia bacterium]